MSRCITCESKLGNQGDWVTCGKCKHKLCYNCSGLKEKTWKSKPPTGRGGKEEWKCKECRTKRTLSEKSETERKDDEEEIIHGVESESENNDDGENGVLQIVNTNTEEQAGITQDEKIGMEARMIRMEQKIDKILAEYTQLNDVIHKMEDMTKEQEDLKKENESLKNQMKAMEVRVQELENCEVRHKATEKKIATIDREAKEKEQYNRNRNLEVNQLDWLPDENIRQVMENLAHNFNIQGFQQDQIDAIHRIPNRNKNKPSTLIVQFKHRDCRDMWLLQKKRIVTNDNMYRNGNRRRIYLNENMTPYSKQLFWKSRNFAKDNDYKYVWFRNGKIMMRKNADVQEVKTIREEEDLLNLQKEEDLLNLTKEGNS